MEMIHDPTNPRLWQACDGDHTLALDWPIDSRSVVWEIGGFEGRWASQMVEKYDPNVWIFEPQVWAYLKLQDRFVGKERVHLRPFGLWTYETILRLWEHDTDGASVVRNDGRISEMCKFEDVFTGFSIFRDVTYYKCVDVCLMNIEGGEFVLLPYMIGLEMMEHFRFFWCQFHPGMVTHGEKKAELIYKGLARTHNVLWDYYPTAVAWERKHESEHRK